MLNWIFIVLIVGSAVAAAFRGTMAEVSAASLASAKSAVDLAIGLVGQMALWLGLMGVLREAGLLRSLARGLEPLMRRLFPEVPADHPAMGAMVMNVAANVLGLGNAATPFGLKAMSELNKLNTHPGTATNAMALFLAINTSGVAVLPLGAVAVRAALGSHDPAGIIVPSILATSLNTVAAVIVAKMLERLPAFAPGNAVLSEGSDAVTSAATPDAMPAAMKEAEAAAAPHQPSKGIRRWITLAVAVTLGIAAIQHGVVTARTQAGLDVLRALLSDWLLPSLIAAIVLFGFARKVKVYEVFVASAKEGFQLAIAVIPFLVAILVAIGMFRASGAMDLLVTAIGRLTVPLGFPAEAVPMALIRSLSGSGALAVMTETMKTYGPDSFVGYLVSVINGTSETTFYVLAVYFGSVQVRATRHTVWACLAADGAGIVAAAAVTHLWFG